MIDKGPPKPSRDVPAKTALARIFNVMNPVVQAYDKQNLSKAATGLFTKVPIDPNVRLVNQEMQQYVDNEELECAAAIGSKTAHRDEIAAQIGNVEDGLAEGDRGTAGVEQILPVPCDNAVPGKQSATVVSNLEATVPLNVTSDRLVAAVSTDATGIVDMQDGKELDRAASVVDGKAQNILQQTATTKPKDGGFETLDCAAVTASMDVKNSNGIVQTNTRVLNPIVALKPTAGTLNDSDDRVDTSNKSGNKTTVKDKKDRAHDQHNAASIDLGCKSIGSKATTGQEREVLVAAIGGNQGTDARTKTKEIMQRSSHVNVNKEVGKMIGITGKSGQISTDAANGWAVVNRSPDRKVASSRKNLKSAEETIRCSNYFDTLANAQDYGENDAENNLEFVVSQSGQNISPATGKQQHQSALVSSSDKRDQGSASLGNKIAGFSTHLMKHIDWKGPVRGKLLEEEERERHMEFVK
ncbi:hypothetical protein A4A49_23727 [Nicotiana attenuata]|uniref:Uncharacterized protein n=1 Tax=Nicotiana attenuata TaxID=49451 RepID=A0A1J6KPT8_NICAT|nr:hypothetical protein A4A49_23727 [Nicotiana attenuata]